MASKVSKRHKKSRSSHRRPPATAGRTSKLGVAALALAALLFFLLASRALPQAASSPAAAQGQEQEQEQEPQLRGSAAAQAPQAPQPRPGHSFYFAYASDLLPDRVRKGSSKTARPLGAGSVADYALAFTIFSKVWRGGVADMVPTSPSEGASTWGLLYEFPESDVPLLDKQKGVGNEDPKYEKVKVSVVVRGAAHEAFTYVVRADKREADAGSPLGVRHFAPSAQYRRCIAKGARVAKLPRAYREAVERVADNGDQFRRKSVGTACD